MLPEQPMTGRERGGGSRKDWKTAALRLEKTAAMVECTEVEKAGRDDVAKTLSLDSRSK